MALLLSGLMTGSSFLEGLSKRTAAKSSAASEEENAVSALVQGHFQERGMKLEQEALLSQIRQRAGASGTAIDEGAPLQAYLQSARETELDIVHVRNAAKNQARASLDKATAYRRAGDSALAGSLLGGAADVLKFGYLKDKTTFKPSSGKA